MILTVFIFVRYIYIKTIAYQQIYMRINKEITIYIKRYAGWGILKMIKNILFPYTLHTVKFIYSKKFKIFLL